MVEVVFCFVLSVFGVVVGCCKQVIVCVCFIFGLGIIMVNGCMFEDYFLNKLYQQLINDLFMVLNFVGVYDVIVCILGGGDFGQVGVLCFGIVCVLNEIDVENNCLIFKKVGFFFCDVCVKECKKVGFKKVCKVFQYLKC